MTDTLADSRTSLGMFAEGVPLVVEDVPRRPATERAGRPGRPGVRPALHRLACSWPATAPGEGWYDARLTAYAPLQLDPSTAALHYAQSIFEGLKAYAQPDGSVATFRPEANAARFARGRPSAGHAAGARGVVPRRRRRPRRRRPRLGAHRPRPDALHPAVPAGVGAVPRRPAGVGVPVPRHRQPGRRVLPARRPAGLGLPLRGLHPGGSRRHRRRQVRRQLRRQPAGPGAGDRGRLRPGRLARRRREALRRGDGRDEPVLRPRRRATTPSWSPPSSPARCCPASPATRSSPWPASSATGSPSACGASTSGGRASPTARSPRPSPAAPPPSSRRSARSRRAPATSPSATARPAR